MKLHVSAHESHHQAYKYCTIKMKNVQLYSCTFFILTVQYL